MRRLLAVSALCAALLPAGAFARSVYLNNVKIDNVQLKNMKFEKVTVRLDEKGDLYIDAPGYQIKVMDPGVQPASAGSTETTSAEEGGTPKLTRKYFLVTEQTAPGMTDYDIDVYVNSKWIRKLANNEEQVYTEITRYLTPGKNTVLLAAHKLDAQGSRNSYSPQHVFRVIIGEGNVGGDKVMIDRPVVDFQKTAADQTDSTKEFTFTTR